MIKKLLFMAFMASCVIVAMHNEQSLQTSATSDVFCTICEKSDVNRVVERSSGEISLDYPWTVSCPCTYMNGGAHKTCYNKIGPTYKELRMIFALSPLCIEMHEVYFDAVRAEIVNNYKCSSMMQFYDQYGPRNLMRLFETVGAHAALCRLGYKNDRIDEKKNLLPKELQLMVDEHMTPECIQKCKVAAEKEYDNQLTELGQLVSEMMRFYNAKNKNAY